MPFSVALREPQPMRLTSRRPRRRHSDSTVRHILLLIAWSVLLFLYGIHQGDLYRTEGLRAILGAEMYRSGDWLIPRLYGEPILTKPPMYYWSVAATGFLAGEVTAWSARLPSTLAGFACILIVYCTIRRYYGSDLALLAGLALPCSFLWLDKASSSEIDTLLVMWVLAAWACFLRTIENPSTFGWWLGALGCVAGGVLTKWTGFLFFYAMAIPFLIWRGQFRLLFGWRHLAAAAIGAGLVWIWLGLVVHELGWSQVWSALWTEGAPRVLHGKSPREQLLLETLVHPFKVLAIALPWSLIVLAGLWQARRSLVHRSADQGDGDGASPSAVEATLICWAITGTIMMSIFPDHNTRQSYSLVPAWTLLGILMLHRLVPDPAVLKKLVVAFVIVWAAVKVGYVELLIRARYWERPVLAEQAKVIQTFVPNGQTLFIRNVKDECLMFTYGRPVRRVKSWDEGGQFSEAAGAVYCLVTAQEFAQSPQGFRARISQQAGLLDAQGDPLILLSLRPAASP